MSAGEQQSGGSYTAVLLLLSLQCACVHADSLAILCTFNSRSHGVDVRTCPVGCYAAFRLGSLGNLAWFKYSGTAVLDYINAAILTRVFTCL
jgi:hypothetical protein